MKTKKPRPASASSMTIAASDGSGSFSGYLATPKSGYGPGLVLAQEIFGVNKSMRQIADDYAAQGFVVFVPDLFWRLQPDIQLGYTPEDWQKAFGYFQAFDVDKGVEDIQSSITALRARYGVNGHVGVMGFCLGGKLAYLSACRTDADVAIGYYGVGIQDLLHEADKARCDVVLHIAALDSYCTPENQQAITQGLADKPGFAVHIYPEVDHAFARPEGEHYNAAASALAHQRSHEALKRTLDLA